MSHLPPLVSDLGLILITAGIVTILFKWLKQPVVLGYIVAGFLVSPHFGLFPSIADITNIATWSEIGVIFLLFALGLEFSFKKLISVGGTASIGTLVNMGSMIAIGYVIGQLMNWTEMESIFLGGMLSMSSTTIIIKAFNDMDLQKKRFAGIVFGMLIVEDLAAILMMVLLTTLAGKEVIDAATAQHSGEPNIMGNMVNLGLFIIICFVVGIYLIPPLLKKFKRFLNEETLLIIAVGLCIGMVLFADKIGFSAALGAFIMGSILAETVESKQIEHLFEPLKNLFGAVFFVSVGMMIMPATIVEYIVPILIFTVVVLVGRVIFATLGVLASGEGLKVSMQAGFSLAQIGEFSFIIATLGMQLGVISDFIYPIIVAVSVITTFTTPYFIKISTPLYESLEKRIPSKWSKLIDGYMAQSHSTINSQSDWNKLLKGVLPSVVVYFAISLTISFLAMRYLTPLIISQVSGVGGAIFSAMVILLLMAPFMNAIMKRKNNSPEFKAVWKDSHFNKVALLSLMLFRVTLCVTLILTVLLPLFPKATGLLLVISIAIVTFIILSQGFKAQTNKLEQRFFENLNNKELAEDNSRVFRAETKDELKNRDIHLEEIEISPNSSGVGKTLEELNFRETTGVDIVSITRGTQRINIPTGKEYLYPFDKIVVAGTDKELQNFMASLEDHWKGLRDEDEVQQQIEISQYEIEKESPLAGKAIKELDTRGKAGCMIIGVDRDGHSISSNFPDILLQEGDVVWLAGNKKNMDNFQQYMSA